MNPTTKMKPTDKLLKRMEQFANRAVLFYVRFDDHGSPVELVPFGQGRLEVLVKDEPKPLSQRNINNR